MENSFSPEKDASPESFKVGDHVVADTRLTDASEYGSEIPPGTPGVITNESAFPKDWVVAFRVGQKTLKWRVRAEEIRKAPEQEENLPSQKAAA